MSSPRRLIVNADDFGRSHSINEAVVRAHREGILTTASLMVNEPGFDRAVALARENPRLGVGLHLSLVAGRPALPKEIVDGLVNTRGEFGGNPVSAGFSYFAKRELRAQLREEIHAQFARFRSTGLPLDHVNGHLHLHLHPVVLRILMEDSKQLGLRCLRLTRDCFWLNARLARGRWLYRISHAVIFAWLARRAQCPLAAHGIRHTQRVFGLLQDAHVDQEFITKLLPLLPAGDSELYSHPSLDKFKHELDALINPRIKELINQLGIRLVRYQDL